MNQATADRIREEHYAQQEKERLARVQQKSERDSGLDQASRNSRWERVKAAVAQMQAAIDAELGAHAFFVHCDDSNFTDDEFWVHFRARQLVAQHLTGDGYARKVSGVIRRAMTAAKIGAARDWRLSGSPKVSPTPGFTKALRYETDTWVYVLHLPL